MEPKSILKSKTIWGAVLMLAAMLFPKLGITADDATLSRVLELVDKGFAAVGFVLAVYGRYKANRSITIR